ncbi:hypothetical protein FRC08_011627 [Ceratobasidium sp. 394]|nr:hypothetical protein FRC08_011627 [Ceratobasidium sp. 394]KAG9083996.1 hypothetical protein FS749_005584 [Ceratobasidium sp. UAMH 11750]
MGVPLLAKESEDTGLPKVISDIGEDSRRIAPFPQFGSNSEAIARRALPRWDRTLWRMYTKTLHLGACRWHFAQHLHPPRIEQVFDADTDSIAEGVGGKRPRSTISRAERITATCAKRGLNLPRSNMDWGPGEIMQELKPVISEGGVRRRRAAGDA